MGKAADNRGTRSIARAADIAMPVLQQRADRQALKDENARLVDLLAKANRDLARARLCIAELRRSKDARVSELKAEVRSSAFAISTLCKAAFGKQAA